MAGTPAIRFLTAAGVAHTQHTYQHDPSVRAFGMEAAAALGLPPAQVFKTLVCDVDGSAHVGIVPVDRELHLKAFATAVNGRRAAMLPVAHAERITGYVSGGISPFGQKRSLPTALDVTAMDFGTIYVSGGRRGFDIGIAPSDIVSVLSAIVAPIAR